MPWRVQSLYLLSPLIGPTWCYLEWWGLEGNNLRAFTVWFGAPVRHLQGLNYLYLFIVCPFETGLLHLVKVGLELLGPSAFTSQVLELQVCATTPGSITTSFPPPYSNSVNLAVSPKIHQCGDSSWGFNCFVRGAVPKDEYGPLKFTKICCSLRARLALCLGHFI